MSAPNPSTLVQRQAGSDGEEKKELESVEQIGLISLEALQTYHCNNPDRRLLSLFGTVYDVTSSEDNYGADGSYKEYAGHDVTLAIAKHKTDEQWLDRFVKMEEQWITDAKGWQDFFESKYPIAGKLDKWEDADPDRWPELSAKELEEIEQGCILM